ncbi:MAG: thioesterase family protein [Gammaproteobacteria bacterium]|jgi:acyl-CoA thioesterase FadM|nr:thioesterase family protein [Gammaproteobacteria bacterium]
MYPVLKFAVTIIKAKFKSKLSFRDSSVLQLRAGISDIDMFMELNNARYFNYMELGRWDFSSRAGFTDLLKKHKWGVAVGGASVRFRRRIPFLASFTLTTRLLCHDGRWFYFLQETHRNNQICSSALMKMGVTSKQGLVPVSDVARLFGEEDWAAAEMPGWVSAWIEAEGQRPWPTENS